MSSDWSFDQPPDAEAITAISISKGEKPILLVCHYLEDEGWAFLSGEHLSLENSQLVSMESIVRLDPTVIEVSNLLPGWSAERAGVGGEWRRYQDDNEK